MEAKLINLNLYCFLIQGTILDIEVMKDVIILGIQQYRVLARVSADFPAFLPIVPRQNKKCGTPGRKPNFLCIGRTAVFGAPHDICSDKLHDRAASGAEQKAERQG